MTTDFNALDYAQQLQAAGVPKEQADVHAKILADVLEKVAFARDLGKTETNLRQEIRQSEERTRHAIELANTSLTARIEQVRVELNARIDTLSVEVASKIDALRAEVYARIDRLETSLRIEITQLRAEIAEQRSERNLVRWMLGTLIVFNIGMIAKLYFP
jgi:hypothetical protein